MASIFIVVGDAKPNAKKSDIVVELDIKHMVNIGYLMKLMSASKSLSSSKTSDTDKKELAEKQLAELGLTYDDLSNIDEIKLCLGKEFESISGLISKSMSQISKQASEKDGPKISISCK